MKTNTLYRPVGEKEMILIIENNYKKFPPRLDWQPIFYPVLNEEYASEIAEKWNTRDEAGNFLGFVSKFEVLEEIVNKYPSQNVGARNHNELWIPSEELEEFNQAILGNIEVTKVFIGKDFKSPTSNEIQSLILNLSNNAKIELTKGDITKITTEAIVNAANSSLLGGGGVDGAIHRAGGKEILDECVEIRNRQGKCKTGEAVVTTAGNLPAKYVIHTVGPIWNGDEEKCSKLLANCYKNSLKLAESLDLKTIAFPNISTGVYKFPKELAAKIAVEEVMNFESDSVEKVIFVCFDDENETIYKRLLNH